MQRAMRAWLVDEDRAAAARIGAEATAGLGVYQNNYRAQLVACLEASFPQTRAWIGDTAFLAAAARHVDRRPPSSWTLDAYARDFPDTLVRLHPDDPEIAEIARIELALEEMFVVADCPAIGAGDLGGVEWESAIIRIVPGIDLVDLETNALAIWRALAAGEHPPTIAYPEVREVALVWRQEGQCRIRAIEQMELQALFTLRSGVTFGALVRDAAALLGEEDGARTIGTWFGRWLADGLILGPGWC